MHVCVREKLQDMNKVHVCVREKLQDMNAAWTCGREEGCEASVRTAWTQAGEKRRWDMTI